MATVPDVPRRNDYVGNSVTLIFAYTFMINDKSEIYALVDGVLKTVDIDYSVQGVGVDAGGTVTFFVAPGAVNVSLLDQTAFNQLSIYNANEDFPSQRVADDLNKHTRLLQQLRERIVRALKFSPKSLLKDYYVDDPTPGLFLRAKNPAPGFDWASVVSAGSISVPVSIAQGGTGAVTVATARAAIFDPIFTTKGDIVAAQGVASALRVGVGTDSHELVADSSQAAGLTWVMPRSFGQGRLTYVSATSLKFLPYNGMKLPVKTSGVMRLRDISSAGVISADPTAAVNFVGGVANQQLAISTTYLVTVFDNAGVLTFDFIAGGTAAVPGTHAPDANTGIEIKTQGGVDDTRTVVGMVRTNAARQFVQSSSQPWVRTWFNDPGTGTVANYTANRTTTSASYVELNSEIRNEPLVWAGEVLVAHVNGGQVNVDGAIIGQHSFGIDGGGAENTFGVTYTDATSTRNNVTVTLIKTGLVEGYHYVTHIAAKVGGGGTTLSCNGGGGVGNQTVLQTYIHK
jgi:hypothetical protein